MVLDRLKEVCCHPSNDSHTSLSCNLLLLKWDVLTHTDEEGLYHPVAYFSRKLLPRKQKFSVIERNVWL